VAGATVHHVTAELDHGPILAQAVVPVLPDDTPEVLAARVLSQEHRIYPQAIADWLQATDSTIMKKTHDRAKNNSMTLPLSGDQ